MVDEQQKQKHIVDEFLDPTHQLLKEFRSKCPGSFRHSQSIVALVEAIALEMDLDIQVMKLAAQYHDIGKMINPEYFSENQDKDFNIHDNLDPKISYQLITRHVSDSLMILMKYPEFPREAMEIISSHHGNSVLEYFYRKSDIGVKDEYRYQTRNPQNVQEVVLMICDCVDSYIKSLSQAGKLDSPEKAIEEKISSLIDSGTINIITIGELKIIKEAIKKELGIYEKRVDYDELTEKE